MSGQKDLMFDFGEARDNTEPKAASNSRKSAVGSKGSGTVEPSAADADEASALQAYTFEEIMKSSTEYFGGDELAASVWAIWKRPAL